MGLMLEAPTSGGGFSAEKEVTNKLDTELNDEERAWYNLHPSPYTYTLHLHPTPYNLHHELHPWTQPCILNITPKTNPQF
jgi:hypothetical protein